MRIVAMVMVMLGLAACSDNPVLPAGPSRSDGSFTGVPALASGRVLTKHEAVRALAMRSRLARTGAPSKNMIRVYDRDGRPTAEYVLEGKSWKSRDPGLPAHLLLRPLSDFAPRALGASLSMSTISHSFSDSLGGAVHSFYDESEAPIGTGYRPFLRSSSHDDASVAGDFYWNNPGDDHDVTLATSTAMVMPIPDSLPVGGYIEIEMSGQELVDVLAETAGVIDSIILANPELRIAGAVATRGTAEPDLLPLGPDCVDERGPTAPTPPLPSVTACGLLKFSYISGAVRGVVSGLAALAVLPTNPAASYLLGRFAVGSLAGAGLSYSAHKRLC